MNTHDIEPLKYGGPDSDDYVTGWNDCCVRIAQDRTRRGEPVAWPEIELTPEQDENYNSWVGSDNRKGFERMVARLAYKLNTSGRGLIDYDAAQHFATELRTIFALAASPQPAEPVKLCDCERGHNGMGMAGRECDCPGNNPQPAENSVNLEVAIQAISALHSNDTDWDTSYWNQAVGRCVSELNKLRSQQPAEPVTCFKCGHPQHRGECVNVAPQPAEPDEWKLAVDHELTNIHSTADSFPSAKDAVKALVGWHVAVATDPKLQPAEPVKVPSDAEMAAIWDETHKPFGGAPFLMSHVEYSRALLARYGQPRTPEKVPANSQIRAILLKHGYTIKPGHDDLKPYVYAAARELIALAQGRSSRD